MDEIFIEAHKYDKKKIVTTTCVEHALIKIGFKKKKKTHNQREADHNNCGARPSHY